MPAHGPLFMRALNKVTRPSLPSILRSASLTPSIWGGGGGGACRPLGNRMPQVWTAYCCAQRPSPDPLAYLSPAPWAVTAYRSGRPQHHHPVPRRAPRLAFGITPCRTRTCTMILVFTFYPVYTRDATRGACAGGRSLTGCDDGLEGGPEGEGGARGEEQRQ
ncbi:hypothetical protein LX36DRAFT_397962 [Colletotrichum falcatum]|nr:hypothetical protein LX36DRAFT_397962 [Colletotrichum falcatum]